MITQSAFNYDKTKLAIMAVPKDGPIPNPTVNHYDIGQVWLYIIDVATGNQIIAAKGHVSDFVWLPDDTIMYYERNKLCRVNVDGTNFIKIASLGQFSWGPKSLTTNQSGTKVAFIKWRGDDRCIAYCDVKTAEITVTKYSCYKYVWSDDSHIVFYKSSSLKQLDTTTGNVETFLTPAAVGKHFGIKVTPWSLDKPHTSLTIQSLYGDVRTGDIFFEWVSNTHTPVDRGHVAHHGLAGVSRLHKVIEPYQIKFDFDADHYKAVYLGEGNFAFYNPIKKGMDESEAHLTYSKNVPSIVTKENYFPILSPYIPEFGFTSLGYLVESEKQLATDTPGNDAAEPATASTATRKKAWQALKARLCKTN